MEKQPIKYDWYQTDDKITLTLAIRDVDPDSFLIDFNLQSLTVNATSNLIPYELHLNLVKSIIPEKCTYKILPRKVEVTLKKEVLGRWENIASNIVVERPSVKQLQRNWDHLLKEIEEDNPEEGSVDQLFSQIYSEGTDDQKKAMVKSFYESGGTVLSTDWSDIGRRTVVAKPPDGTEFKPW